MKHNDIVKYFADNLGIDTENNRELVKGFVDYVVEHLLPRAKWDELDLCDNQSCHKVELDEHLEHSIHYGGRVCPECIRSI
jgi:hypothetical protein